ncbi:hypothetical protein T484DRAFT_2796061 [Baffinella frigidus]|nr:hypothetical protein T484DRAFT_2796061 [Cryptophyta sp. CCMP2293]
MGGIIRPEMGGVVEGVVDGHGGVMGGQEGQEGGMLGDLGGVLGQMGHEGGVLGPNMSLPASVAPPPPRKKVKANDVMMLADGMTRSLSAYNLFVRGMLQQLKAGDSEVEQGEHMKRVGLIWRGMSDEDKGKWRPEGEEGMRVGGNTSFTFVPSRTIAAPTSYQMFVKQMTQQLKVDHPECKQAYTLNLEP